ncbi:MAG: hypothetical protein Q8S13_10630, partial [Dehalococcoidia bacterium]|nr:hypothetical protein [Dehalococcoidia bacterium]
LCRSWGLMDVARWPQAVWDADRDALYAERHIRPVAVGEGANEDARDPWPWLAANLMRGDGLPGSDAPDNVARVWLDAYQILLGRR